MPMNARAALATALRGSSTVALANPGFHFHARASATTVDAPLTVAHAVEPLVYGGSYEDGERRDMRITSPGWNG